MSSMETSINDAETNLLNLINQLIDKKEDVIFISKNGIPVAELTLIKSMRTKRLGIVKKEMACFNMSQEEFDNI